MLKAQTPQDLASRETLLSMSGLEAMQAFRDGTLPGPPIAHLMGYAIHTVEPGHVTFRGTPGFDVLNPMGTVHGGWYGTLLDSSMACAVMTTVPKGSIYTTMEYKINIVRSIPLGTEIESSGVVSHAGRSSGIATGEIRGVEDGKLYATGSTTCIIMKIDEGS
ncbi:PaaI family thioesterase [Pseudaestuariivita rosea]|uniref:PaaI family thioesterase n=1 Tax=Pseudaestuariivita rosea TaxID=2763263 RepID=UPI001ABBA752|nr:PaaI family thioesterase [Pseudaestuariivita rosea]